MAQCAEIAGADSFCSTCDAAKTGKSNRSSHRRPEPPCPERRQQRNVGSSRKRAAASSTCTSPSRNAGSRECPHRSHFCSADDHVHGPRDCRPDSELCRAPPQARGRQLPAATMGARSRPERADTAHSPDAAAARRKNARADADQAARSDRKAGACTATTRGPPPDSRPARAKGGPRQSSRAGVDLRHRRTGRPPLRRCHSFACAEPGTTQGVSQVS